MSVLIAPEAPEVLTISPQEQRRRDIFRRAANRIEVKGWTQGYGQSLDGGYCLLGAIAHELNAPSYPVKRYCFFGKVTGTAFDFKESAELLGVKPRHAYRWNDRQITSHTVTRALRALANGATWDEAKRGGR